MTSEPEVVCVFFPKDVALHAQSRAWQGYLKDPGKIGLTSQCSLGAKCCCGRHSGTVHGVHCSPTPPPLDGPIPLGGVVGTTGDRNIYSIPWKLCHVRWMRIPLLSGLPQRQKDVCHIARGCNTCLGQGTTLVRTLQRTGTTLSAIFLGTSDQPAVLNASWRKGLDRAGTGDAPPLPYTVNGQSSAPL